MKLRALGLFLAALLFATGPVFGALTDGLVLYYSFDTNTGATVYDQSGNGHNATVYGASYTSTGRIGSAFHYDGTNDHILAGNLGYQGKGTISFWMYADAVENWRNPFSTDYASWDDCLRFEEGGTYHDFVVGLGPIVGGAFYTSNMQSRTWYHVTFAWTTNGYWGWLNGKPVFSGTHNNQLYLDFNNVAMGNGYSTEAGRYWKGLVDEVRIYNRVLSDTEVAQLAKPSDGLILYYSFDTNTGSTVVDQSGNGHTGTVYGATYTAGGAIGGAYHFDGVDDRILGGSLGYVPTGSICFWMYADSIDNWRNPFSTDYASWDDNIHFTEAADHSFEWGALGLEPGAAVAYTQSGLQSGRWYHVALTWDGLVTRGYLDGTLANSTPYPDPNASVHPDISGNAGYWRQLSLTFNNIAVGNSYDTSPNRYWKGMVDEVRIYNRALSDAEIAKLASPTNDLVLYFNFDEAPAADTVNDKSGYGNNGTVHNAQYAADGHRGGCYYFNGSNSYVVVPDNPTYDNKSFTLSIWAKSMATDLAADAGMMGKHREAYNSQYYWLYQGMPINYYSNVIQATMIGTEQGQFRHATVPVNPIVGQWGLCTLTYQDPVMKLYVNGSLVATQSVAGYTGNDYNLLVGAGEWKMTDGSAPQRFWNGYLDEARIYRRALSADEVKSLYDETAPQQTDGLLLYYSFDTNTGSVVYDQSGHGNNGVVSGATFVADGVIGGGMRFINDDWVSVGDKLGLTGTLTQMTVCAWVKSGPINPAGGANIVANKQPMSDPYTGWTLSLDQQNHAAAQLIATYPQMAIADGNSNVCQSTWKFVCGQFEVGSNVMRAWVYVDGVLQAYQQRTGSHGPTDVHTPLTIGAREEGRDPDEGLNGVLDELRIYSRLLSSAEIVALYGANKPGTATNKLAKSLYYNFDTDEHGIVTDQSGDGNTGTVRGATWVPNGVRGGAYQFTGTNWIESGDIFDLAGSTTQLTVCAWIKADPATPTYEPTIVNKDQEASPYRGWMLEQTFDNHCLGEIVATWPQLVAAPNSSVNIGNRQWHFVCSTFETYPNFMRCKVYVDGVLEDTGTRTGPYDSTEASTPLTIGAKQPHGIPHWGFSGLIDEVRINDRILSDAEILSLYDADKPSEPNPKNGLELYYSFDTNTGSTVYDQSGNGHTGLIYGPTYTASGRFGAAYQYDGVNDHILAGNLGHLGQGTISFWMYADALENWRNPFSTDYASWDDCLRFEESSLGEFVVGLGPILGGAFYTTTMQPKTWYHVAFAWTGTGYWGWLNGQLVFSGSHNNQLYLDFNNVAMGNGYSTSPGRYWKGMVDEVRIYSRVLQPEEISTLADTGTVNTMGWLTVNIEPEGARIAEAEWRLASDAATNWHNSGFSLGLDAGNYTVVFKPLGGWVTPLNANVAVTAGSNSFLSVDYEGVTADTVPPVIVSIYPPDGYACLGNDVPMIVVVTDNVAVASVRFNHSNAVDFEPPNTYLYTRNGVRGSYNPVDIVALDTYGNVTTQTINYVQSSDLLLSALWDGYWRIRNPYTNTIECTWSAVGGVESGAVTAVANRDNFFSTRLGPMTVQLYVDGVPVGHPVDSSKVHPDQGVTRALSEIDSDGDGMSNGEEELAGTDPNSEESLFSMGMDQRLSKGGGTTTVRAATRSDSADDESYCVIFSWPSGTDSSYTLETSTDVWTWKAITGAINMPGTGGTMSYTNTVDSPQFYLRIRAQKLE